MSDSTETRTRDMPKYTYEQLGVYVACVEGIEWVVDPSRRGGDQLVNPRPNLGTASYLKCNME